MSRINPKGQARLRSYEQMVPTIFTNVAAANAAGVTAPLFPGRIINLTAGGTGSVNCLCWSDGTNWIQITRGSNAI